jgi:hypothetical protein
MSGGARLTVDSSSTPVEAGRLEATSHGDAGRGLAAHAGRTGRRCPGPAPVTRTRAARVAAVRTSWTVRLACLDMALDDALLSEAKGARERLLEHQHELERARADYHFAVARLHSGGATMRESAECLGLSRQRIHQIIDGGEVAGAAGSKTLLLRLGLSRSRAHRRGTASAHLRRVRRPVPRDPSRGGLPSPDAMN